MKASNLRAAMEGAGNPEWGRIIRRSDHLL